MDRRHILTVIANSFIYLVQVCMYNNPLFSEITRNPLSFSELSMYTGGLGSLDLELTAVVRLQSEPQP